MFPLPTRPLAGQAGLGQDTVCGSTWLLLVDLLDQPDGASGPRFYQVAPPPRFSGVLPHKRRERNTRE